MAREWLKGLGAALLLSALVWAALQVDAWRQAAPPHEALDDIARGLFGPWVFPFELLSVLLLAALFGALYISQKQRRDEEGRP